MIPNTAFRGVSFVLDHLSVPAAIAYSLRRLSAAYMGSAIRVQRSSDNAQADIGFVSDRLDVTSLMSFVGSGTGIVVTWYDQSGNGKNATVQTGRGFPVIVNSGTLVVRNGYPAIFFNGCDIQFDNSTAAQNDFTLLAVFAITQDNTGAAIWPWMNGFIYGDANGPANDFGFGSYHNFLSIGIGPADTVVAAPTVPVNDGLNHIGYATRNGTSGAVNVYLDGTSTVGSAVEPTGPRTDSPVAYIGSFASAQPAVFWSYENIIWPSVLSVQDIYTMYVSQTQYQNQQ